jgi:hypothetical protein
MHVTETEPRMGPGWPTRVKVLACAILVLALLGCSKDEKSDSDAGFTVEPASEIGPDAFTAPFTVDPAVCDKQAFLADLQSRPDALSEWARVLGLAVQDVPAYVATLQPAE